MTRGRLRVYLGVAPGAGATHALLAEGRRRSARGTDLVTGTPEDPALGVDVPALIDRRPAVVVVDDLGRANPPGSRRPYRWQDVEDLLDAGIDVIGALDVRYVASLADVVERITGTAPDGTVPDRLLREADQLELVDITPQAVRRRLAHGRLYPADEIDAGVAATFRPSVLAALRELALTWTAGVVPRQHAAWLEHVEGTGADGAAVRPPLPERILVALSGGPGSAVLLRQAARLAGLVPGGELLAVHVVAPRTPPVAVAPDTEELRRLALALGATFQQVIGDDVATALLDVARAEHVTQIVVGADAAPPPTGLLRGFPTGPLPRPAAGTASRLVAAAVDLDVHVLRAAGGDDPPMPPSVEGLPAGRRVLGFVLAVALPLAVTVALRAAGTWAGLAGDALVLLLAVVVTAMVGGLGPALLSAVAASTLLNYFFIPPLYTFRVTEPHNVITLVVFVLVGASVGAVVHRAARLAGQAARAAAESRTLAAIASGILRGEEALPTLLEQVRAAFGMTSATLLEEVRPGATGAAGEAGDGPAGPSGGAVGPSGGAVGPSGGAVGWRTVASRGPAPDARPEDADVQVTAGEGLVLALSGRTLAAADRTVLQAFAVQAQVLLDRDRLARAAAVAERLKATERLRDALLAAVGHDLRTPLASATTAVSSLLSAEVDWSPQERDELLVTAQESLARLTRLVADLLDLSRLRTGALSVVRAPTWLDEVVPPALDELGPAGRDVVVRLADDLPAALADAALVERVLANLLGNAVRYSPPGRPPMITAAAVGGRLQIRVVDRGPGIPAHDLDRVFVPFQRLGDTDNRAGLGLGLALSRGLTEAMDGDLRPEDTPGGGLTMVMSLPVAPTELTGQTGQTAEPGQREREAPPS